MIFWSTSTCPSLERKNCLVRSLRPQLCLYIVSMLAWRTFVRSSNSLNNCTCNLSEVWRDPTMPTSGVREPSSKVPSNPVIFVHLCPKACWHERSLYNCTCNLYEVWRDSTMPTTTGEKEPSSKVSTSLIVQFYMDCVKGPHKAHLWEEGTV